MENLLKDRELSVQPIEGYEGLYVITTEGEIYSLPRWGTSTKIKKRKTVVLKNGYVQVQLCKNGKTKSHYVHILVANTFIGKPDNTMTYYVVNHIDGNKTNNKLENLEYIPQSENIKKGLARKKEV